MKKYLSCFLIFCTVISMNMFWKINVNAKTNTIGIELAQKKQFPIPKLISVKQISKNQIEIGYDIDVDMKAGMKASNYWIQDVKNDKPENIATLGKNDKVNKDNSLNNDLVEIKYKDESKNAFILTFEENITKDKEFKLIVCYVTVENAPLYNGDNGAITFIGK